MKAGSRDESSRGRVERIKLKAPLIFNGAAISHALIEIDHINFGLNKNTRALNSKKRTNFSLLDIEKFVMLLNEEYIAARNYRRKISQFEVRVDCPVAGRFLRKEFIMIFDTDYDNSSELHTITLYQGW